jgi:integrase
LTWVDIPTIFPTVMASIFKRPRSPFWFCSYRAGDGRWLKKSTKQTDRRKATEFCMKLEQAEQAALSRTLTTAQARKLFNEVLERAGDEPLDNFTVESWLREWTATKKAARGQKTGERYEKPIRDFLAHLGARAGLPLRAVTPTDVRSFRDAERKLGKSSVTANLAHKIVASALGAAVKMGYIATNPASAVDYLSTHEAKAQKETFTPEEIATLLEFAPSDDWGGLILLGAFAGMRLGDAMRLKWGNVDLQAGAITFTPSKTARLGKKLILPIHPEIEAFLLKHPAGASDEAPLFPSLANLSVAGKSGASMAFRRIMQRAGISAGIARKAEDGGSGRNVSARSFHSLRHSFVTALAHANVAVELRQKLAGHASEEQSLHYTHPGFAALREAVEKLPGMRNA